LWIEPEQQGQVSIHAPREGCDKEREDLPNLLQGFNSRTPGGVRRYLIDNAKEVTGFQFTHPGRGATSICSVELERHQVSIHAPREGCDRAHRRSGLSPHGFNSRTPGGVRLERYTPENYSEEFQFTHPGRGATSRAQPTRRARLCFNSRTPGGVRHQIDLEEGSGSAVSIHAPREGCDRRVEPRTVVWVVSIHAPREGCDPARSSRQYGLSRFQFTHPGRGATYREVHLAPSLAFQFTHPGRGATAWSGCHKRASPSFNSRTPGGVRHLNLT